MSFLHSKSPIITYAACKKVIIILELILIYLLLVSLVPTFQCHIKYAARTYNSGIKPLLSPAATRWPNAAVATDGVSDSIT